MEIIITGAKRKQYVEDMRKLQALMGQYRDLECKIVSQDQYLGNERYLDSRTPIIFIGVNEYCKPFLSSISWKYRYNGFRYGWLGTRAVIDIADVIPGDSVISRHSPMLVLNIRRLAKHREDIKKRHDMAIEHFFKHGVKEFLTHREDAIL